MVLRMGVLYVIDLVVTGVFCCVALEVKVVVKVVVFAFVLMLSPSVAKIFEIAFLVIVESTV